MTRKSSRRSIAAVLVAAVIFTACGASDSADDPSSPVTDSVGAEPEAPTTDATTVAPPATDSPVADPPVTDPPVTDPPSTEPPAVEPSDDTTTVDGTATTEPSDEPANEESDDDATGDIFDEEFLPLDEVDDVPVCQAYAGFFNRFVAIAFGAAFVDLGESVDGEADESFVIEQLELISYLGTEEQVAIMRRDLLPLVLQALEPIFVRAEAAVALLSDAGFTAAELETLAALRAGDIVEGGSIAENDPRLMAAAQALVAQFGSFFDAMDAMDELDPTEEDTGTEWFETVCPRMAEIEGF